MPMHCIWGNHNIEGAPVTRRTRQTICFKCLQSAINQAHMVWRDARKEKVKMIENAPKQKAKAHFMEWWYGGTKRRSICSKTTRQAPRKSR